MHRSCANVIRKREGCLLPTSVLLRPNLAELSGFGSVYAKQSDMLPMDLDGVAVDNRRAANDFGCNHWTHWPAQARGSRQHDPHPQAQHVGIVPAETRCRKTHVYINPTALPAAPQNQQASTIGVAIWASRS